MTKPLSNDLRERLVSAVDSGLSRRTAARRFGVAASTAPKASTPSHQRNAKTISPLPDMIANDRKML